MTNADINKARLRNRLFEELTKEDVFNDVIKYFGEALFKIDDLKQEIARLQAQIKVLKEGEKR